MVGECRSLLALPEMKVSASCDVSECDTGGPFKDVSGCWRGMIWRLP